MTTRQMALLLPQNFLFIIIPELISTIVDAKDVCFLLIQWNDQVYYAQYVAVRIFEIGTAICS